MQKSILSMGLNDSDDPATAEHFKKLAAEYKFVREGERQIHFLRYLLDFYTIKVSDD